MHPIKIEKLTDKDLSSYAVWKYVASELNHDVLVAPDTNTPILNLENKLVSTEVVLANGTTMKALLGNIDTRDSQVTKLFLTLSAPIHGKWFTLARYFDPDWETNGPGAMANLLGANIRDIFPIAYDISHVVAGATASLVNSIDENPTKRLSRDAILALSVPK